MKTVILCSVMLVLVAVPAFAAYPTPAVVQPMDQWTLTVTYSQPQQIMLRMDQTNPPQRFWYTILTVTNQSSFDEVSFYPVCELITDTFEVIAADKTVQKSVFEVIKLKHQGSFPFLESLDFADRRILRGQDNTRDFAIIWPDFDLKAKAVSLFIAGLSNETAVVEHPKLKDEQGDPQKVFLRKTLQLKFAVAGDEAFRADAVMKEIERNWVMR
ncbi:MAG: hypothetical protein H8E62_05115 [Planctomycetes bacterium]|nr:hypothetical protein [Planctomycetota bacterium]